MTLVELLSIIRQATIENLLTWRRVIVARNPSIIGFGYVDDYKTNIQDMEIMLTWYSASSQELDILVFEVWDKNNDSNDVETCDLPYKLGVLLIDLFLDVRKKWLEENQPATHDDLYRGDELDAMADEEEILAEHLLVGA